MCLFFGQNFFIILNVYCYYFLISLNSLYKSLLILNEFIIKFYFILEFI